MKTVWIILILAGVAFGQDVTEPTTTSAAPAGAAKPAEGEDGKPANADAREAAGNDAEDCEEAWEYLEFLKTSVKEKIEMILQDTLFEPRALLEQTVADTMTQTLEIRDAILTRTKKLRSGDESIKVCPGQGVNQEQFLTLIRMDIMSVLLKLIEPNSASPEKLQEIGKELLAVRSKINAEITRIIMLREAKAIPQTRSSECDCGILKEISDGLQEVMDNSKAGGNDTIQMLTMLLMTVDGRIGVLYNEILGQLDEDKRKKATDELKSLKEISTQLNEIISKMLAIDSSSSDAPQKKERIVERDVPRTKSDVDRQLQQCRKACPSDCESCGAKKIEELQQKLTEYKGNVEELEEDEAKESVRNDLMQYLAGANSEMTDLLTDKANNGNLTKCDAEKLDVLEKIKGPLWMLVNITIFGDTGTMKEMIEAIESALTEMSNEYCSSEPIQQRDRPSNECDQEEILNTRKWISDIDNIISSSIFKLNDDKGRVNAMLGFIELKSNMDDRVRALFTDNLKCREEVEQIKNVYMNMVTSCLAEMMNPKFRFELVPRAERVQCIKQLRVTMEDRRGELLLREVERRISQENLVAGAGDKGQAGAGDGEAEVVNTEAPNRAG